jgi:hypothetical protein
MIKTISIVGSAKSNPGDENPYLMLCEFLEAEGLTPTVDSGSDFLVAINHNQRMYEEFIHGGGHHDRAVLIRLEPESVFPLQYKSKTTNKYGLIITPGSVLDHKTSESFVGWPYKYNLNPAQPDISDPSLLSILNDPAWRNLFNLESWEARPKRMTMIAANKVSPLKNANYLMRRKLASQLPLQALEVYGPLWTDKISVKIYHRLAVAMANFRQGIFANPISIYGNLFRKYPAARGTVPNKHVVLRETQFSLVVENSNSYVSEKIIDAIINGAIPIYIGPDLRDVGLPINIAIQSTGSPKEIIEITETLDSSEIETILIAMRDFFGSSSFLDFWTERCVYQKVSAQIADYFRRVPK